ncbi:UNVERIFIED_CONTAM: hypothetical protein NCL1_23582 [Trichonephila clavipes]
MRLLTQPARSCGLEFVIRFCLLKKSRWLWPMLYFHLANLALFSNTTKTRLHFICRKKGNLY